MSKPRLVMFHPNMGLLGGAQRDLIVALPEHAKRWSITVATLNAPQLLIERCEQLGIDVLAPDVPWQQPTGPFAEVTAKAGRSALKGWRRMRSRLQPALDAADSCCIVL